MEGGLGAWWRRRSTLLETGLVLAFFLFYLLSFNLASPVNGPHEVFGQDSRYILEGLDRGKPYRWNPQSHLLYHWVVEGGYDVWEDLFGHGIESTYAYLKLFTAACGAVFLGCMVWLFRTLGLTAAPRAILLLLTGVTLTAWFHSAAFETHALALPALALYLVAAARLRDRPARTWVDRVLLVGSLAVLAWTRVDLVRLLAVSALWLVLPAVRRHRRSLVVDLALAAALFFVGTTLLVHLYLEEPLGEAVTFAFDRDELPELEPELGRIENLTAGKLAIVGRAVSLYSFAMPVEARPAARSFFAPPTYELDLHYSGKGRRPSTRLFLEPARNMLGAAIPLLAACGTVAVLLWIAALSARGIGSGDPFHAMLAAQVLVGWLFYTWFNPGEPFLWLAEFMPIWIALIADHARRRGRVAWVLFALLALALLLHNWFAFYLPFRHPA